MLLDILLGIPLLIFILLGLRDGIIRKLVASIVFIGALFLGQIYMHEVGMFLAENGWVSSANASMYGFLAIFLSLAVAQGLIYKILAGNYKIGGIADRIGGTAFGFIEGTIFLSSILFIFALSGSPERETSRDSRLYKPIVNIVPQILDFTSTAGPGAFDKIKNIGTPKVLKEKSSSGLSIDSSAILDKEKQNQITNKARETVRKLNK